jgi:hypothetical protein
MKVMRCLFCIVIAIGIATTVHADTVLLNDNFDSENGGVGQSGNYTNFANWSVTSGTVDLAGYGSWAVIPNYGGVYVDIDGSNWQAGTLTSKQAFNLTPGTVLLQFDLAGSHRGLDEGWRTNVVRVKLGDLYDESFTLNSEDPFTTYSRYIDITTTTNSYLSFQNMPDIYTGDNIGAFLDNVKLTSVVPEPATMLLLGFGILGLAGVRRIRK